MKGSSRMAMQVITSFGLYLAVATAFAQPAGIGSGMMHGMGAGMGPGMVHGMGSGAAAGDHGPMAGPTAMLTKQDAGSAADMGLVHDLLANNTRIKRTVTNCRTASRPSPNPMIRRSRKRSRPMSPACPSD